jgi:hypothetical protein
VNQFSLLESSLRRTEEESHQKRQPCPRHPNNRDDSRRLYLRKNVEIVGSSRTSFETEESGAGCSAFRTGWEQLEKSKSANGRVNKCANGEAVRASGFRTW